MAQTDQKLNVIQTISKEEHSVSCSVVSVDQGGERSVARQSQSKGGGSVGLLDDPEVNRGESVMLLPKC